MSVTPISYYGGKQSLLRHMLPLIPFHNVYTEAFCGGATLFFAKSQAEVEVINDLNSNLINFYKTVKNQYPELKKKIDASLHSRREHVFAQIVYDYPEFFDTVLRAWALWILSKQSFASKLDGAWGYDVSHNTMSKKIQNCKDAFTIEISKRLENAQIENTDALRIIKTRDTTNTFHFVDPPYVNSDCGHYKGYTTEDFEELLKLLATIKGKFMLTMFPHTLIDQYADNYGWHIHEVERTISASKTSRRKQIEIMVCNYETQKKLELF